MILLLILLGIITTFVKFHLTVIQKELDKVVNDLDKLVEKSKED